LEILTDENEVVKKEIALLNKIKSGEDFGITEE
jgi:hypothetical protein